MKVCLVNEGVTVSWLRVAVSCECVPSRLGSRSMR